MRTFQDFLMHYNNLDVGPFVKAVVYLFIYLGFYVTFNTVQVIS